MAIQSLTPITSIIFVHGLRGHRLDTWTKQGICWPKDLLPQEPALSNVRILSFGYDSRVVDFGGHVSQNSSFKHSISLLSGLCRERDDTVGLVSALFETEDWIKSTESANNIHFTFTWRINREGCM